jgi:hypothetical protein
MATGTAGTDPNVTLNARLSSLWHRTAIRHHWQTCVRVPSATQIQFVPQNTSPLADLITSRWRHTFCPYPPRHKKALLSSNAVLLAVMGRDSSDGLATRYGLDGPRIESRCRRDFSHQSRLALGSNRASYTMGTGCFSGVKWPRRGVDHQPHLALRLKKE